MRMKYTSLYWAIVVAALISQICILIGSPLQIFTIVSFGTAAIAASAILACAMLVIDKGIDINKNNELMCILGVVILTLGSAFVTAGINAATATKVLLFVELPVFLFMTRRYRSERLVDWIYTANLCYPFLFLLFSNSSFSHRCFGEFGEFVHQSLTLGYNNPNEAAIHLMVNYAILLSAVFHYEALIKKGVCIAGLCIEAFLIFQTDCRTIVVLFVLITVLTFFLRTLRISRKVLFCVFCFPLVFALLLILFPGIGKLTFLNESVENGRVLLIERLLDQLTLFDFVFGNFATYSFANLHNSIISIFSTVGFVATSVYWGVLFRGYAGICKTETRKKDTIALQLGFLAVIVHGAVEAVFLVGGSVFAVSVFLLAYLIDSEKEV